MSKRFMVALVCAVLLLAVLPCGIVAFAQEEKMSFSSVSGSWDITDAAITGGGDGNVFCMSDFCVGAQDSWEFSADVHISSGNAAGIVFGVNDPKRPLKRWHCVNASQSGAYSAMFRETNAKNDYIISRGLTGGELTDEVLHLKLVCDGGATVTGSVNGTETYTYTTQDYNGGYFGVMCCGAQAQFTNIRINTVVMPEFTNITTDIETDVPFSPDERSYWAAVDFSVKEINITASGSGTVSVNGIQGESACVKLNVGLNSIPVSLTGECTVTAYINVVRRQDPDLLYNEPFRQRLHFSPEGFSLNDPNGLIYDETTGIYHLFFQCDYPSRGYKGGGETKSWGHAVSRNMLDWEELPLAITPDKYGVCWSGSGVIDRNNTSGLFDESTPEASRMVFIYTYYNTGYTNGNDSITGLTSIGLAYSPDHGQTFIKLPEPVIKNEKNKYTSGFRDPKVIWYADENMEHGGTWVLIGCGEQAFIFTSPDLIHWERQSVLKGTDGKPLVTECPDVFPMEYEGGQKWIICAAGVWYVVGQLDVKNGKMTFTAETDKIMPVNGVSELWAGSGFMCPENYASQTFYNTQGGRRVQMSWMRDFGGYGGKLWWNGISLPTELKLIKAADGPRLAYSPIAELTQKRGEQLISLTDTVLSPQDDPLAGISGSYTDIFAVIKPGDAQRVGIRIKNSDNRYVDIYYDAAAGHAVSDKSRADSSSAFVYDTPLAVRDDGTVEMRIIVDNTAVEAWFNNTVYHAGTAYITPLKEFTYQMYAVGGTANINRLEVYRLNERDRFSISNEQAALNALYERMTGEGEDALKALDEYNALTDGQRYCMPQGAAQQAQRLSGLKTQDDNAPGVPAATYIVSGAAVLVSAGAAVGIGRKKKKK